MYPGDQEACACESAAPGWVSFYAGYSGEGNERGLVSSVCLGPGTRAGRKLGECGCWLTRLRVWHQGVEHDLYPEPSTD